jgi:hypothetical protein
MLRKDIRKAARRKAARASVAALALLLGSPVGHAQCQYPDVASGGIWTYFAFDQHFTITLVNLTDYLLYNSGDVHWVSNLVGIFQNPFAGRPVQVKDLDGDGKLEQGVPPYSGVTWASATSTSQTPQHYEGELILELKGFTGGDGVTHPGPTWPNKFRVWFSPQYPHDDKGMGTWIALRPEASQWSQWDGRNLYRSGVWTTPHFPGNVSYPSGGDDLELRNIMTISNRYVVATLYSTDHLNVVIVVRQTNWVGPAVPSDADPVAGMDAYKAWRLDFAENTKDNVPGSCNH